MACSAICVIDGTFDGFLTVVHKYYYERLRPADIVDASAVQQTFDTLFVDVETEQAKAGIVSRAISAKISLAAAEYCYAAFLSENPRKYMAMLRYVVLGFKVGPSVDDRKYCAEVADLHGMARKALGEAYLLKEFARFTETEAGVFYCDISPKSDVLPLLAGHFIDRFMNHSWVIHDVKRGRALLYNTKECLLTDAPKDAKVQLSEKETRYQAMWKGFFKSITVESRKNYRLQRQHMPLYFRKHVTEYKYTPGPQAEAISDAPFMAGCSYNPGNISAKPLESL